MRRTLRITIGFLYLSVLLLIAGITRLAILGHAPAGLLRSDDTLGILGCTFGGIGIPVCLWLIWIYRRYARRAADILSGKHRIAHWTCSAGEWDRYLQTLEQRAKKSQRIILIIFGITSAMIVPVAGFALVAMTPPGQALVVLAIVGIVLAGTFCLFLICWLAAVYLPVKMLLDPSSRDVYIGTGGVVAAGKFFSWQIMGGVIRAVRYEPGDPGTLLFQWSQPGVGAYGTSMPMEVFVPVPQSHDGEAREVVRYFTERF